MEAPETPAHTFIGRAFKHALFGTPAPPATDRKATREQPRNLTTRERPAPSRPIPVQRRKSADFTPKELITTPIGSPARRPGSILLTPGTGTARRKTVSFYGEETIIPDVVPGHRVSRSEDSTLPYKDLSHPVSKPDTIEEAPRRRPRGTQQTLDAKSDTRRYTVPHKLNEDEADITIDLSEPRSRSGKHWKAEYESSAADLRKANKKERLAKRYAKDREDEMHQVSEDLRREQNRSADLENQLQFLSMGLTERVSTVSQPKVKSPTLPKTHGAPKQQDTKTSPVVASITEPDTARGTAASNADSELVSLRLENTTLRAELESQRRTAEETIAHLRRENEALQLELRAREALKPVTSAPQIQLPDDAIANSDIWADVAGAADAAKIDATSPTKARRPRSPLKPRAANAIANEISSSKTSPRLGELSNSIAPPPSQVEPEAAQPNTGRKMSKEREEAGRRRIEERRRAREQRKLDEEMGQAFRSLSAVAAV